MIYDDKELVKNFNFIICGKEPEYIKDEKNRFFDINTIPIDNKISLIGLTIEIIKKSILTVSSQSALPTLSLLLKIPVLEWGHEKSYHTKTYNPFKTKIDFLDDRKYNISSKIIFKKIKEIINF